VAAQTTPSNTPSCQVKILEIRRALGMALTMEQGDVALILEEGKKPKLGDG
jgi:hypothetical protein